MYSVGYRLLLICLLLQCSPSFASGGQWLHSKDELFGYEVDYPNDWQVSSPRLHRIRLPLYDGPMVVRGSRLFTKFKDGKVVFQVRISPLLKLDSLGNLFKAVQSRGVEVRELDFKVGGLAAKYIAGANPSAGHLRDIFFRRQNIIFSVSAITDQSAPGVMEPIFERMLRSFRFSDASSDAKIQAHFNRSDDVAHPERFQWQKRANKLQGYELEYSQEWGFDGVATFTERRNSTTCPGCCAVRIGVFETNDPTVEAFAERHLAEVEQRQGKIDQGLLDIRPVSSKRRREKIPFRIGGEPAMRFPIERPGNNYNKVIDDIIFKHGNRYYDINRVCVHALQIQFSEVSEHLLRSFKFVGGVRQPLLQSIGQNENQPR